jgi:hypothetical protein
MDWTRRGIQFSQSRSILRRRQALARAVCTRRKPQSDAIRRSRPGGTCNGSLARNRVESPALLEWAMEAPRAASRLRRPLRPPWGLLGDADVGRTEASFLKLAPSPRRPRGPEGLRGVTLPPQNSRAPFGVTLSGAFARPRSYLSYETASVHRECGGSALCTE